MLARFSGLGAASRRMNPAVCGAPTTCHCKAVHHTHRVPTRHTPRNILGLTQRRSGALAVLEMAGHASARGHVAAGTGAAGSGRERRESITPTDFNLLCLLSGYKTPVFTSLACAVIRCISQRIVSHRISTPRNPNSINNGETVWRTILRQYR